MAFLVLENHGKIPSYNVIPVNKVGRRHDRASDSRGGSISKLFPSHGKPIIHLEQIQHYKYADQKGLTPDDPQFPKMPEIPGANAFWFINPNEIRVDLSVYESDTDQYTNQFIGYSGTGLKIAQNLNAWSTQLMVNPSK